MFKGLLKIWKKDTAKPHQGLIPSNLQSDENSNARTQEEELQTKFEVAFFQAYTESAEAVRLAKAETDVETLKTISELERSFPNLEGLMELFQLDPQCLKWGSHRDGSEVRRMLTQLMGLDEKLTKLNDLRNTETALITVGIEEQKNPWRKQEINKEGYTLDCFEGITFLFKDRLTNRLNYNSNIYYELAKVKGTFEYDATVYVYKTETAKITEFFKESEKSGRYLSMSFSEKRKIADPRDLVAKIDLPSKKESETMEEIILAFERRLIRMGYLPSDLVREGSMKSSGFNRFMDNHFGTESKRRPCLIWPNEEIGVRMDDFEDALEILYLTNKLLLNPKINPFFNQ